MSLLRFTGAGVVATPTTVQVRATVAPGSVVPAGAPRPSRDLTADEVEAALHHLLVVRRGPRTRPVDHLVLTGAVPGLAAAIDAARAWGLARFTLHLDPGRREARQTDGLLARADDGVVVVRDPTDLQDLAAVLRLGRRFTAVLPLEAATLPRLDALTAAVARLAPPLAVLSWPLGGPVPPPPAPHLAARLPDLLEPLRAAGVPTAVRGLPQCAVPAWARPTRRSRNRWYVDADHPAERPLLFFPDVARFSKTDSCRFCAVTTACDGAPAPWFTAGRTGTLRPVSGS